MRADNTKRNAALPAMLAMCLLVFLIAGGIYFSRYLQRQIFVERTTQLNEITAQVRVNLSNALDTHWSYLTTAVNALYRQELDGAEDTADVIARLERFLDLERGSAMLMLLDSHGNCYDSSGRHGVWSDIDLLADGGEQYIFISDSPIYQGSNWAFVQKLEEPAATADGRVVFTHMVLLKGIDTLTQYYDSTAYGNQNETYILKSNGTRMHDSLSSDHIIQAYNVLKVLEEMEGQTCPDLRAELAKSSTISGSFRYGGTEYYYCLTALEQYDTLLLFLIPANLVAPGTVNMVAAVIRMLLIIAVVLLVMLTVTLVLFARQQTSARLFRQEQENLRRQEELNQQLERSNSMLAEAKESAEQAFQIAEDANRAKSAFLSTMSHDIRTPMNAIVGFAALLDRDVDNPDKVREYTRKITASSQHLLGLINDILDISKIEAGKTTLNLSEENIVDLIENLDAIIRPQMKAKGHTFELYSRALKHEQVIMDKLRLNQILLNLLSNALKYTPEGGLVALTVQELPQLTPQLARFRFIVADNGYGMSREYQEKLFQAFTREENSVTNKIQGTGLGMAITKNLLDLMGGNISVDSEQGKGSTFTVDLELHISEQTADHSFWQKHGIASMLAVDDEEAVCRSIQLTMEDTGVKVDYVLDGQAAVDAVRRAREEGHPYGIVLLDWNMPNMDGVETARRIRREAPEDAPILVLSSCDWSEIEAAAQGAGVDVFLPKPFFLTSFRQRVEQALSQEQPPRRQEALDTAEEEGILAGMHILVAEDNEINVEILSELLDMSGASCHVCKNGQEVVETFRQSAPGQYQLILMDVQMPVMNGYDATRAIRELDHPLAAKIPIIAMTANAFAEDIRDALDAGMDAHVAKPVDMAVLEQTVKAVLSAPQDER